MLFMHRWILGAGLWAMTAGVLASDAACPGQYAAVQENFLSADCATCWQAEAGAPTSNWRFDWIVPAGTEAPLASAALPEAAERLQRLGSAPPPGGHAITLARHAAPPLRGLRGLRLQLSAGPAWHGYFGLQGRVNISRATRLPPGSQLWLALVEILPAGSEGNAQPRALLRSVAGPLPLEALAVGRPLAHLRALHWPEGAQPVRLQARGWIEAPDGRMLAVAADRCPTP
jgi:hypothetical protein